MSMNFRNVKPGCFTKMIPIDNETTKSTKC